MRSSPAPGGALLQRWSRARCCEPGHNCDRRAVVATRSRRGVLPKLEIIDDDEGWSRYRQRRRASRFHLRRLLPTAEDVEPDWRRGRGVGGAEFASSPPTQSSSSPPPPPPSPPPPSPSSSPPSPPPPPPPRRRRHHPPPSPPPPFVGPPCIRRRRHRHVAAARAGLHCSEWRCTPTTRRSPFPSRRTPTSGARTRAVRRVPRSAWRCPPASAGRGEGAGRHRTAISGAASSSPATAVHTAATRASTRQSASATPTQSRPPRRRRRGRPRRL